MEKINFGMLIGKNIHFVGIGGVSMSGLAEIMASHGCVVSGSDSKASLITQCLQNKNIIFYEGHRQENLQNVDLVVYSAAISQENPELILAKEKKIPCIERADLLGIVMLNYKNRIAISGTHGKTTTTSMVTMIMLEQNLDLTVHIGGNLPVLYGGTRVGGTEFLVTEACEYVDSFLKLSPNIAVILNVEYDHPDYFDSVYSIRKSFLEFAKKVSKDGYLIACSDDENIRWILENSNLQCKILTYGTIKEYNPTYLAQNIEFDENGCGNYELIQDNTRISNIKLNVPGSHNVCNSIAATVTSYISGCSVESIRLGLEKFKGTGRRFELKYDMNGIKVIDDYAHHPTAVAVTLDALKKAKKAVGGNVWCVFQPHTYTRTKQLLSEFAKSFHDADYLIITDIYAAREKDLGEIHSKDLVEKVKETGKDVIYLLSFESIVNYLKENVKSGDIVVTMGAGNIHVVADMYINSLV